MWGLSGTFLILFLTYSYFSQINNEPNSKISMEYSDFKKSDAKLKNISLGKFFSDCKHPTCKLETLCFLWLLTTVKILIFVWFTLNIIPFKIFIVIFGSNISPLVSIWFVSQMKTIRRFNGSPRKYQLLHRRYSEIETESLYPWGYDSKFLSL